MSVLPRPADGAVFSLEQFERLPEEDAYRLKLSRGRLVREPRAGTQHGWLTGRLVTLLGPFVGDSSGQVMSWTAATIVGFRLDVAELFRR